MIEHELLPGAPPDFELRLANCVSGDAGGSHISVEDAKQMWLDSDATPLGDAVRRSKAAAEREVAR